MYERRHGKNGKRIATTIFLLLFLLGMGVFLYPYINGYIVDSSMEAQADSFLSFLSFRQPEDAPPEVPPEDNLHMETLPDIEYPELWTAMQSYNQTLFQERQSGLTGSDVFSKAAFSLMEYDLDSEVFGVISIPAIDVELPLYLGATDAHMAEGAAQMGQTSLPIGGMDSNCVIAGHRGYNGAAYFRFVDQLQPGDTVTITNLWETLNYVVKETRIIWPYDVDAIRIQPGRDLVTLLTCHPYASGGKQRMLIICERSQ